MAKVATMLQARTAAGVGLRICYAGWAGVNKRRSTVVMSLALGLNPKFTIQSMVMHRLHGKGYNLGIVEECFVPAVLPIVLGTSRCYIISLVFEYSHIHTKHG